MPLFFLLLLFTLSVNGQKLSAQAEKIQKFIPENAVIAHRGTIYWAPELTEAAFRWARNSGADYLELDVHRTKDGQLVVMHDKTLKRTTDVAVKFPGRENDPISSFTLEEIFQLNAGSAFNKNNPGQARTSFTNLGVLVFEDVFRIAEGRKIKRNADGSRVFQIDNNGNYVFRYEDDEADNGNRPGIYIETKSPESYPGLEQQIYQELCAFGWNPLDGNKHKFSKRFYKNGKVNVGNTKGKILVQTFSRQGMQNFQKVFKGQVPMSFLIKSPKAEAQAPEQIAAEIVDFAHKTGSQFIGTNIYLNQDQINNQMFLETVKGSGLKVNLYSFNTTDEMEIYYNQDGAKKSKSKLNGMITNRADLTTDFYFNHGVRRIKPISDPDKMLDELGYFL